MTRPYRRSPAPNRSLLWLLTLWLVGCATSPAPGHCWLVAYGAHGEQEWSCTNGAQPPECNSYAECKAKEGAPQLEDTTP